MGDGPELARRQLRDLADASAGAIELLGEYTTSGDDVVFTISLDTSGLVRGEAGIKVRDRERFLIFVGNGFPFAVPSVVAAHRRWAGTPHVQWASQLCLYASPSVEWNPADGMRGLVHRLSEWVERASAGTLDPEGQPLHPPAMYSSSTHGTVVVHPDLGDRVPWFEDEASTEVSTQFAWCAVGPGSRVDVLEWIDIGTTINRVSGPPADLFHQGRPTIAIPIVLASTEFGFEYPQTVKALGAGLAASGCHPDHLLKVLALAAVLNRQMRTKQVSHDAVAAGPAPEPSDDDSAPILTAMLVGTPSRRIEPHHRLTHLAAWRVDTLSADFAGLYARASNLDNGGALTEDVRTAALAWFDSASAMWMRVMESRPEVTRRRDHGTGSDWLTGKRVLVLGCGALGGPVAELCVRGGVKALTVADRGVVTPGILVRQPYTDDDIGRPKALALAQRLSTLRSDLDVTPQVGNVRTLFFEPGQDLKRFDLVIDATADASARAVIERFRRTATNRPPLVTMVIGHNAQRGLVTTNLPGSSGAGVDAFRKVSLLASTGAHGWIDIREDLFPATPRTDLFFPEPGCSDPTFLGGAAQTTALAAMLLDEALTTLPPKPPSESSAIERTTFASAVRFGTAATMGTSRAAWPPDVTVPDASGMYEVRISADALLEARSEVRRGARVRGIGYETGGMLLGSFDDSTGVVHVDKVTGPPPDSYLLTTHYQHGTQGTQDRVDAELLRTGDIAGFVGLWHSHPLGKASPSETDEQGMAVVVGPDGSSHRALMLILGGDETTWLNWCEGVARAHPDVYARIVPRGSGPIAEGHPGYAGGVNLQALPPGPFYRGGYSHSGQATVPAAVNHRPKGRLMAGLARLVSRDQS